MPPRIAKPGVKAAVIAVAVAIVVVALILAIRAWHVRANKDFRIVKHSAQGYEVLEIYNVLTPEECDSLIAYSTNKGMKDSDVLAYGSSSGTEVNTQYRTSKTAWVRDEEHPIAMKLAQLSMQLTGIPIENQEMLQVAHYTNNGKFNEHFDACVYEDKSFCDKMNNYAGQRRSTLLVYLNDDFDGGETEFVSIGIKVKPEKGKAVLFWNTDDQEVIIPQSKHRANPVHNGEKWICTKWNHPKPYSQ